MKITIDVNGKAVEIELTDKQIETVKSHDTLKWQDIKSWNDVLATKKGYAIPYPSPDTKFKKRMNAYYKLSNAIELINEDWVPDWKDDNQSKYLVYFYWDTSKNGFSSVVSCRSFVCLSGSALYIGTRERAEHIAKYFEAEYLEFLF